MHPKYRKLICALHFAEHTHISYNVSFFKQGLKCIRIFTLWDEIWCYFYLRLLFLFCYRCPILYSKYLTNLLVEQDVPIKQLLEQQKWIFNSHILHCTALWRTVSPLYTYNFLHSINYTAASFKACIHVHLNYN